MQTILLVDDNQKFREELRECLSEYRVIEAANGPEALKVLKKANSVDLVILDVMMPGPRGTEVLREIKKVDPKLCTIILTGYSSKDVAIEALQGRADEYLEKPLDIGRAKQVIARLLEAGGAADRSGRQEDPIGGIKRYIERNWNKRIGLNDAAGAFGLSPKYLSRLFKEKAGRGFNEYSLGVKIGEAKKMLKQTADSIDQISDRLGYQNTESFIRTFKKLAGTTPARYRNKR